MDNIPRRIRRAREEKNYTQEYMASQLGISTKSYSNLENSVHRLTLDRLHRIAEILNTSVLELLSPPAVRTNKTEEHLARLLEEIRQLKSLIENKRL